MEPSHLDVSGQLGGTSPTQSPEQDRRQSPSQSPALKLQDARNRLSLDLSSLPPLVTPAPPSNTLIITKLENPAVFHPASLSTFRTALNDQAVLYSFSPLKSMRRIICSFYANDDAIRVKEALDGQEIMGNRVRVYFGERTPIDGEDDDSERARKRHLAAPQAEKMFFISPPPSPPHGWEMRNEDPPNTEVHAEDLATALSRLNATASRRAADPAQSGRLSPEGEEAESDVGGRKRSASTTLVYRPESPLLPSVTVEDTTGTDAPTSPGGTKILAHTARPPVELMNDA